MNKTKGQREKSDGDQKRDGMGLAPLRPTISILEIVQNSHRAGTDSARRLSVIVSEIMSDIIPWII